MAKFNISVMTDTSFYFYSIVSKAVRSIPCPEDAPQNVVLRLDAFGKCCTAFSPLEMAKAH